MILELVDAETRATLERYGFDAELFERHRAQVAAHVLAAASNVVTGTVDPPAPGDVTALPKPGTTLWDEARSAGIEALAGGRVAQVVLAGGMATRFGGVVKGAVEALDGRSFLAWKLGETARLGAALGHEIPVALMTSFATDEPTRLHVAEHDLPEPLWFSQFVSLRLTPEGELFRTSDGRVSLYGPGHGDLLEALRDSGTLGALRGRGVAYVAVSNVDNLGARLDPVVVGLHVLSGAAMTVEVAPKEGDAGGAPARVDGRLGVLELPQFPPGFDHTRIRVFNTNTATFDAEAIDRDFDLPWLYVERKVDGRQAVQLERLYHHASWSLETAFLEVPRSGPRGRFYPIKEPHDLQLCRDELRATLAASLLD